MADNDLARNGAPIEDEIPVRQTIAAAKRMEALAKEERVEEKKREREAEKAEKAGEKAAWGSGENPWSKRAGKV